MEFMWAALEIQELQIDFRAISEGCNALLRISAGFRMFRRAFWDFRGYGEVLGVSGRSEEFQRTSIGVSNQFSVFQRALERSCGILERLQGISWGTATYPSWGFHPAFGVSEMLGISMWF